MPVSYFSPSTAALPAASLTPLFLRPAVLEIQRAIQLGLDVFLQSLLIDEHTIAAELGRQAQQQFHQANGALELINIDGAPVLIRLMQSLLSQHIEALPTPASEACISALRTGSQSCPLRSLLVIGPCMRCKAMCLLIRLSFCRCMSSMR